MSDWYKLSVVVPRETEEAVGEILVNFGVNGLEIEDTADYLSYPTKFAEFLPEVEQKQEVKVSCYFSKALTEMQYRELYDKIKTLENKGLSIKNFKIYTEKLSEEDWENSWKKYFHPTRISRYLTIVPSWTDYFPKSSEEKIIRLDPGMAFGTGTHPTTKLSLYALEQVLRGEENIIDVGTGSGVLSIASVLLGAKKVRAYDVDEVAIKVATENIALNPGLSQIEVSANDLLKGIEEKADVIVANILADILLEMLTDAYHLLKPEAYLILSGIITGKLPFVLEKAVQIGFKLETQMQQGEWHCLVMKKSKEELFFG